MSLFPADRLKVQVYTTASDAFVLGLSRLGFETLGSSSDTKEWREILCDANQMIFRRGGQPSGASNTLDVGYMSITLVNSGDPMTDPGMLPNVPIRIIGSSSGDVPTIIEELGTFPTSNIQASNTFVATSSTPAIWFTQNPGSLVEYRSIKVIDTSNDTEVFSLDVGDYPDATAWRTSPEAALWTVERGQLQAPEYPPFYGGWFSYFLHWTNSGDPTTVQRRLSGLVPGREYRIDVDYYLVSGNTSFGGNDVFSTGVLFTGVVEDIKTKYTKDGNTFVTLTAADGVRELANTPRYGAIATNQAKNDTFYHRIDSLMAGTTLPYLKGDGAWYNPSLHLNLASITTTTGWSRWGTNPSGATPEALAIGSSGGSYLQVRDASVAANVQVPFVPLNRGIQYTVTGLTVGRTYTVTADLFHDFNDTSKQFKNEYRQYRMGVYDGTDTTWGPVAAIIQPYGTLIGDNKVWVSFKATATSQTIRIARDFDGSVGGGAATAAAYRPEELRVYSLRAWRVANENDLLPLQDVNYESTVFNHLQMASDSVGMDWWVNPYNIVQFQSQTAPVTPLVNFSDVHDPDDPKHSCYTDIDLSFDTKNTVNVLEFENHGRRADPSQYGNYLVDDTLTQYSDSHSVDLYNARLGRMHTSLPDWALTGRAVEVLAGVSMPDLRVLSLTVDLLEQPLLYNMDLFTRVNIKYRDFEGEYRVVGLEHRVTPTKWLVTITVRKN